MGALDRLSCTRKAPLQVGHLLPVGTDQTWEGQFLPRRQDPRISKHQKDRKYESMIDTYGGGVDTGPVFRVCLCLFKSEGLRFSSGSPPPARQTRR